MRMKKPWLGAAAGSVIGLLSFWMNNLAVLGFFIGAVVGLVVTLATRNRSPMPVAAWSCSVHVLTYHLPFFVGLTVAALGIGPESDQFGLVHPSAVFGTFLFVAFGVCLILRWRLALVLAAAALGFWLQEWQSTAKWQVFSVLYVAMMVYVIHLYRGGYFQREP